MLRVADFFKVSPKQFVKSIRDVKPSLNDSEILDMHNHVLKLPERVTKGSAGYDFVAPFNITLSPGQTAKIPTGIRVKMEPGWVLMIFPRSGLGFKYRLQLNNTVGIIDEDYFYSDNEGHIFIKITNDSNEGKMLQIKAGEAFAQGIFVPFGITMNDECNGIRNGGFGSTSK